MRPAVCCVVAPSVIAVHLLVALDPLEPHRQQLLQAPQLRLDACRTDAGRNNRRSGQARAANGKMSGRMQPNESPGLWLADSVHAKDAGRREGPGCCQPQEP